MSCDKSGHTVGLTPQARLGMSPASQGAPGGFPAGLPPPEASAPALCLPGSPPVLQRRANEDAVRDSTASSRETVLALLVLGLF